MFGQRIVELRKGQGLTQTELAKTIGISRSALSLYEIEKREPDFKTLKKMASLFDVSVDYLLGRTNANDDIEQEEPFYTNSRERKLIEFYREYEDNDFSEAIREGLKEFFPELVFGEELCPNEEKILSTFRDLNEDCQDIVIGKAKELLREQRYEESVAANSSMRKAK